MEVKLNRPFMNNTGFNENNCFIHLIESIRPTLENESNILTHSRYYNNYNFKNMLEQTHNKKKNKNIFISINNDIANLYIEENYTNVNIAIMMISIRVMIIKYNIQN